MALPQNNRLPIPCLAGIFSNTTATYKFYWFVAMLDILVKERKTRMSFWEIIAGMVSESWYPIHYFKLSFGKSERRCRKPERRSERGDTENDEILTNTDIILK